MNRSIFKRLLLVPVIAAGPIFASGSGSGFLTAAEMPNPAQVMKHTAPDGNVVQALMFQLSDESVGVAARDHLIFVDTSASQVGAHRLHALAVVESMLKSLPESDRVRLFAVDVQSDALMPSLAGPGSESARSGIAALKSRIPLGATNLQAVVRTSLETVRSDRPVSITYIGDGMSTADLLETRELQSMVAELRGREMPFHAYGVGPDMNLRLLGVIAHQTGGFIDFDKRMDVGQPGADQRGADRNQAARDSGQALGLAVRRPVYFPSEVKVMSSGIESLPLLPLRPDRETIHIIRGTLPADVRIAFSNGNPTEAMEWRLLAPVEQPGSAFLAVVAKQLDKDGGIGNSLAGRGLMQVFQGVFGDSVDSALKYGTEQLERGQVEQAAEIARQVTELDPRNSTAKILMSSTENFRIRLASQSKKIAEDDVEMHSQPEADASLTRDQEQAIRVKTEKLRSHVSNAIDAAHKTDEPEMSLARLKQVDNAVRSSIDIAPEDRLQLQKRLESEINQLKNLSDKRAQEKVQLAEELAQLEAQKRLTEQLQLDEERLEGLIDRIRGLMLDGKHGRDEAYGEAQNVADVAIDLRPGEGTSSAARFDAEAAQQLVRSYRLRARRADQFLEALHQVELAHIPFPDEPPIRFPKAEVWQALTQRRRAWATVDLRKEGPNEKRIQQALTESTEVTFTDQPLKEALDYLESIHHIEIYIDAAALSDEGISTDQNVNLVMSGVTLRSCLRLMLEPLNLTYIIEDEVMKITTQAKADEKMTTRVYPVADLAIRITANGGGLGGGGGGGGQGGQQGGQQGGGGGIGGGGGGQGGGGGGFGGGGFFNIPAEQVQPQDQDAAPNAAPKFDNKAIRKLKKKRA